MIFFKNSEYFFNSHCDKAGTAAHGEVGPEGPDGLPRVERHVEVEELAVPVRLQLEDPPRRHGFLAHVARVVIVAVIVVVPRLIDSCKKKNRDDIATIRHLDTFHSLFFVCITPSPSQPYPIASSIRNLAVFCAPNSPLFLALGVPPDCI